LCLDDGLPVDPTDRLVTLFEIMIIIVVVAVVVVVVVIVFVVVAFRRRRSRPSRFRQTLFANFCFYLLMKFCGISKFPVTMIRSDCVIGLKHTKSDEIELRRISKKCMCFV